MKKRDLKGSTVVITGASSGIGNAAAYAFAKAGANLILGARSETLLQEIASECEVLGGKAIPVMVDVTDKKSVKAFFETALDFFGNIDVWINNAGVGAVGEFDITPLEAHEQVIRTNLLGPLYAAHEIIPYFKKQGHGTLITTNSTGAFMGAPFSVAYSASKFGLRGLSEALRFELEEFKDIHICDIFASFVNSPGMHHAANYVGKEIKPAPPLVEPEKVAEAMVKLAESPRKSIHLGSTDYLGRLGHAIMPGLAGKMMNKFERSFFKKARKVPESDGNLFGPNYDQSEIHGHY